jgi:hypothetical protein
VWREEGYEFRNESDGFAPVPPSEEFLFENENRYFVDNDSGFGITALILSETRLVAVKLCLKE